MKAIIETLALVLFLAYPVFGSAGHGAYAIPSTIAFFLGFILLSWEVWLSPLVKRAR